MTASLREPGAILLLSCYELGHQPLGLAWPRAFLERAGFAPTTIDLAVEPLDETQVGRARLVAISVPMHTALRLGVRAAERIRRINSTCRIVCHGLYAELNAEHLLGRCADVVLGAESEAALVALARSSEAPAVTLGRIRTLAYARAGRAEAAGAFRNPPPERPIPARLTEPWFC